MFPGWDEAYHFTIDDAKIEDRARLFESEGSVFMGIQPS